MRRFLIGPIPRIILVGLFAMSLQRAVFAQHPLGDIKLQFVLALVATAGAVGGADRGAVAGFALGLMYDFSGNTPLGLTALAYGVGGIVAGSLQSFAPEGQWWFASLWTLVGAAVGELAVPFEEAVTGEPGWLTGRLFVEVPVVAIAAAVMSPALMPVARWMVAVKRKKWKVMTE